MLYFIVNIFLSSSTMLFLIFLIGLYLSKKNMNNLENKVYRQLLISNFFMVFSDMVLYFILEFSRDSMLFIHFFVKTYTIFTIFYMFFLTIYLYVVIRENEEQFEVVYLKNRKKYLMYIYIFMITTAILQFILPLGIEFTDEFCLYSGPAITMLVVSYFPFNIASIFFIIKNIKKLPKKKVIPFYILGVMVALYLIVYALNPYICALSVLFTLVSFLMFHTIENPDIKLIAKLQLAKTQAEKSNEAKSDFLSSMSHEIRTPLNAIVGLSQMMKETDDIDSIHRDLDDVIIASQNLLEIINGILDINKIDANKMEVIECNYKLFDIFDDVLRMIRIRLGNKPIELRTNFDDKLPEELFGDKEKIKQILTNLLTNAVKYTDKGFIDFNVFCKIDNNKCTLILMVKDTGRGMKEEQIAKLFTRFNRLEEDKDSDIEGTGLGLAITKALVELLNGTIKVDSIYGEGSTFTVSVEQTIITSLETRNHKDEKNSQNIQKELANNQLIISSNIETSETTNISHSSLLVVDDNNINLKVATKMLKELGYNVDDAHGGLECLEIVEKDKNKYNLIFMDIMMPDLDGVETMKKLKATGGFNIPIIALTADSMEGSREKYLSAGFDEYIAKPVVKQRLEDVLNRFISNNNQSNNDNNNLDSNEEII